MIAAIVPAHNEEQLIGPCLQALQVAAAHRALEGEAVAIVVALDRCSDATAAVCRRFGVRTVRVDAGCVGVARAVASEVALSLGARWIGCTDADSRVPGDWLVKQLHCGAGAFCGVVTVEDWLDYSPAVQQHFLASEHLQDGHAHVHGANMGFSAAAYRDSGGFLPLVTGEDVALITAIQNSGARVARLGAPRVVTSARRHARATRGFSDFLKRLEQQIGHEGSGSVRGLPGIGRKSAGAC